MMGRKPARDEATTSPDWGATSDGPSDGGSLMSVAGVTKSFGGIAAVRDVTFAIERGESVGLVGPNGAGKTTLFNCICGQLRPDHGTITLGGTRARRASLPTRGPGSGSAAPTSGSRCSPT